MQGTVHSVRIGPLLARSIVPVIYSGNRSPNGGHKLSAVASLACGHVGMATRAPQPSRHNRHSDCSPSGSNYPYISKECWPLCEPRPPPSFFFFLKKISAVRPVVETSHNFMTDTSNGGGRLPPSSLPADTPTRQAVKKNIRCHCPIFCFTPQPRGVRVQ